MQHAESCLPQRHFGFTCPNCGCHFFGTHTHHASMGQKYPSGSRVGVCHGNQHTGNGCSFEWLRADAETEAQCIYHPTRVEWEDAQGCISVFLNAS